MKSSRTLRVALVLGALAAAPALASAQTGSPQQPQRGQQPPPQQQDQKKKSQGSERSHAQQQQQQQGQKKATQKVEERISAPIENGCTYTVNVNGKIEHTGRAQPPKGEGQEQGGDQGHAAQERVSPDLTVVASMTCPNAADVRITDMLKTSAPVTPTELEEMVAKRASIATARSGRLCMYVPQFELKEDKLKGMGVTQLCRVSAQEEKPKMEQPKEGAP